MFNMLLFKIKKDFIMHPTHSIFENSPYDQMLLGYWDYTTIYNPETDEQEGFTFQVVKDKTIEQRIAEFAEPKMPQIESPESSILNLTKRLSKLSTKKESVARQLSFDNTFNIPEFVELPKSKLKKIESSESPVLNSSKQFSKLSTEEGTKKFNLNKHSSNAYDFVI